MLPAFALAIAALFTGAAFYINAVEHPARMSLDDAAALAQWKPAYKQGAAMQAPLAVIGCLLGAVAGWGTGDWRWWAGALAMLANWPYTLLIIMPVNNRLMAAPAADTRALLERWNALHAGRTCLGALAAGLFLWALVAPA